MYFLLDCGECHAPYIIYDVFANDMEHCMHADMIIYMICLIKMEWCFFILGWKYDHSYDLFMQNGIMFLCSWILSTCYLPEKLYQVSQYHFKSDIKQSSY